MVFDFGSEMYVWSGKMAPLEARKKAFELAKELWDGGYDYSECAINPIFQRPTSAELSKGQQRPDWALLRSAKQHMEPCLFREKFFDWPDKSALIKVKTQENEDKPVSTANDISSLEPYDAQLMLDHQLDDPDLELEGSHLGRGTEYYDQAERRLHQVYTPTLLTWQLMFTDLFKLDIDVKCQSLALAGLWESAFGWRVSRSIPLPGHVYYPMAISNHRDGQGSERPAVCARPSGPRSFLLLHLARSPGAAHRPGRLCSENSGAGWGARAARPSPARTRAPRFPGHIPRYLSRCVFHHLIQSPHVPCFSRTDGRSQRKTRRSRRPDGLAPLLCSRREGRRGPPAASAALCPGVA